MPLKTATPSSDDPASAPCAIIISGDANADEPHDRAIDTQNTNNAVRMPVIDAFARLTAATLNRQDAKALPVTSNARHAAALNFLHRETVRQ